MKLLYISSLVSDKLFEDFFNKGLTNSFTGQKYHGLFVKGLASSKKCQVTALSQAPIKKSFFRLNDCEDGILFHYVPLIAIPILKQLTYFLYTFIYTLLWCIRNYKEEKVIMCSIMRIYQYPPIWLASCLFNCKNITVACDVPWMTTVQVSKTKLSFKQNFSIWLGKKMCGLFDGYVFLTETMNEVLNPKKRPYIVVEGFCDINMANIPNSFEDKYEKQVIIYAGGLNEKYGIINLIDAVKTLKDESVELWLYGTGDLNEVLQKETHHCIKYMGPRSNHEVVEAEVKATILINPRPTTDEYTRYSFPSKTLEYMVSGTYTLTTHLSGIPSEYFDYCGIIDDFSTEGIAEALRKTLSKPKRELHEIGIAAKHFVLENKNNTKQTNRVINFIHEIK